MSDIMVTSVYVIVALKLCSEVGNDEYIVLSYFGDRRVSAFEVIQEGGEGGFEDPRSQEAIKKLGLSR